MASRSLSVSSQSQSTADEDSESTGTLDLATGVDCHRAILQRSEGASPIASVIDTPLASATITSNLVPTTASGHPATTVTASKGMDYYQSINLDEYYAKLIQ